MPLINSTGLRCFFVFGVTRKKLIILRMLLRLNIVFMIGVVSTEWFFK